MTFAVEVLLDPSVDDPWGTRVDISQSRLRYELRIERRKGGKNRPVVVHERVSPILASQDRWAKERGRRLSSDFRSKFLRYGRKKPFLDTVESERGFQFELHQDKHPGRVRPATAAEATVLSSITTAEFPHLFALREELRSWCFVQLDPAGLRNPASVDADDSRLLPDGSNLAAVLARIEAETKTATQPHGRLPEIAARLGRLVSGVVGVDVIRDEARREFRVLVRMRDGDHFSARVASDGTLRLLALLTMLLDPKHRGLVYFEEPENGVHPSRLRELIALLRELVHPSGERAPESIAQLILNSHSPVVLKALHEDEMLFADIVDVVDPKVEGVRRKTRIRDVRRQGNLEGLTEASHASQWEVERILETASR